MLIDIYAYIYLRVCVCVCVCTHAYYELGQLSIIILYVTL